MAYAIMRERIIKKKIEAYHRAFDHLAKNPRRRSQSLEGKRILLARARLRHKHTFQEMKSSLKSQTGQRDNIIKGLLAAETFLRKIEELFISTGVPPELTRLSLVESSFNLNARSKVGASGVWQFMRSPGNKYLLIDDEREIDERLSPLKASVAAARLLRDNHKLLRSWVLSVTSYNHGFRGFRPFIRSKKTGISHISHLFSPCGKKSPLGWASRNYYAEFLAVLYAEAYRQIFYGEPPIYLGHFIVFKKVNSSKSAATFAIENQIPIQLFRLLNPDIQNIHRKLPKGILLAVPGEKESLAFNDSV